MKANGLLVSLLFIFSQTLFSQNISLNDLERFCDSQNWESVNQALTRKGWVYHDSKRGDSEHYHVITWAYNRSYDDSAEAWFYLYTHDGASNKVSYTVFNQQGNDLIQNAIGSKGYNLKESHIEDGEVISVYQNNNHILETSLEKRVSSGYYTTITGYSFTLIHKSGVYDPDNGKKVSYYYGDVIEIEYNLKDGELDGEFISYYENGVIKKRGFYRNGVEHGQFFEYDENGEKTGEYQMKNGEFDGLNRIFLNGKVSEEFNFENGQTEGKYTRYYYDDESGKLVLRLNGQFFNGIYDGKWVYSFINEGIEEPAIFTNYSNGLKNGPFQDIQGDSLVIGQYRNDQLHGDYRVYLDFSRMIMGGKFNLDTAKLLLYVKGNYLDGKKNGTWSFYDITGSLGKQGRYNNDQMTGEWRYYYPQMVDSEGNSLHYSGELYQIDNYRNDQLNGQSQRFSYLEKIPRLCDMEDPTEAGQDTCWSSVYHKIFETINFRDGLRHGKFELRDSTGQVITSGNYFNDLREGEWVHWYLLNDVAIGDSSEVDPMGSIYYFHKGNYNNDKKDGEWSEFMFDRITKTWQYRNGELHGKSTVWNLFSKPGEVREFANGVLTGLVVYDSLGMEPLRKYEIMNTKCTFTEYFEDGYLRQECWIGDLGGANPDFFDFYFAFLYNDESDESQVYPDGEFWIADKYDKPLASGFLKREQRYGHWTYFYYDQDVRVDIDYADDVSQNEKFSTLSGAPFSGKFYYADEEEGTYQVIAVKNGVRHGNSDTYDQETGERISREKYREGELR